MRFLVFFLPALAFAAEPLAPEGPSRSEVRIFSARGEGKETAMNQNEVVAERGAETLDLKADLFEPENRDGSGELRAAGRPPAEFRWKVRCNQKALDQGCADAVLAAEGEALRYKIPDKLLDGEIEITVAYVDGLAKEAYLRIRLKSEADRLPLRPAKGNAVRLGGFAPSPSRVHAEDDSGKKNNKKSGGGAGFSGSSRYGGSDSGSEKRSRGKKYDSNAEESAFSGSYGSTMDYAFGGDYAGGSSGSGNTKFQPEVAPAAVVSCSHVPKPGGGTELRCEEPGKKVLKVRRRAERPATLKGTSQKKSKKARPGR